MAIDKYYSYTNNDLIYEAITGQTRDPNEGPNKMTPLNTPIISADIGPEFAIINMTGKVLRFVSLNNSGVTPYDFIIDSNNIVTIKEGLIYDIILPDKYEAKFVKVSLRGPAILFMNKEERLLYAIVAGSGKFTDKYGRGPITNNETVIDFNFFRDTDFIFFIAYSYYDDEEISEGDFTADYNPIDPTMNVETTSYDIYLLYDNYKDGRIHFDTVDHDSGNSDTESSYGWDITKYTNYGSYYSSYYTAKWLSIYGNISWYDQKKLYVGNDGYIYGGGDYYHFNPVSGASTNYSYISNYTKFTLFSAYTINKAWIYDNAIMALTNNGLLLVAGDNRNNRLTPNVNDDVITTPYITDITNVSNVIIDRVSPTYYVIPNQLTETDGELNILQRTTNSALKKSNLTQIEGKPMLGYVLTQQDFDTPNHFTLSKSGEVIYYKPELDIPTHTENDSSVQITLGPNIYWAYTMDDL